MRFRSSNTKTDTLQIPLKSPNLNRRPLVCTTKNVRELTFLVQQKNISITFFLKEE